MTTGVRDHLTTALRDAMRARDGIAVSALRTALGAIANAEAVDATTVAAGVTEVDRVALTEEDVVEIVAAEVADLVATGEELRSHGRLDEAAELDRKAAVLRPFI
jgi:uncharacterized protein YqeY